MREFGNEGIGKWGARLC